VALAVPVGTLPWWAARLREAGVRVEAPVTRFGERALPFADPHGLALALVESDAVRPFTPWDDGPVPADRQVRGLHGVRLVERDLDATTRFLVSALGFVPAGEEDGWHRYAVGDGGSGRTIDVRAAPPDTPRGRWGTGAVHHVAWSVPDDATELAVRERVREAGRRPTEVIDRFWFRSVYFMEPGGALFELATEGPGFAVDEPEAALGTRLVLPPWLEARRAEIEGALTAL
jgi:glyoxalase family protein